MTKRLYRPADFGREKSVSTRTTTGTEPYRSGFRRDYARLIHSPAFRRLQGKTQVFPGIESDFFRNRLSHSLEVAQIAKSLALRINSTDGYFAARPIDTDLVELAGLAHDLGHPPFGHNGETALDACMRSSGGFEGNAQTFRILSRLEKKELCDGAVTPIADDGSDQRLGLNLTYRSLAAIAKYDRIIPVYRDAAAKLCKGIYESEHEVLARVKKAVSPGLKSKVKFKTIECWVMDIADDIAYSTYDLEDAFKAGFLSPLSIIADISINAALRKAVTEKVRGETKEAVTEAEIVEIVVRTFEGLTDHQGDGSATSTSSYLYSAVEAFVSSSELASNGYVRTKFTSDLVSEFIAGVTVEVNNDRPELSKAFLNKQVRKKVETLKHLTYEMTIMAPRLRVSEQRGYGIVRSIFEKLSAAEGHLLLPHDFRETFLRLKDDAAKKRLLCDFIAGMTDRYAVEFYGRVFSIDPESIFKPH